MRGSIFKHFEELKFSNRAKHVPEQSKLGKLQKQKL